MLHSALSNNYEIGNDFRWPLWPIRKYNNSITLEPELPGQERTYITYTVAGIHPDI